MAKVEPVETVVDMAKVEPVETVVDMARKTAQKLKVQKAPKEGVVPTPILIPALVAKPMKVGYPISSEINLAGTNWPSKILYCWEYQLDSPTPGNSPDHTDSDWH